MQKYSTKYQQTKSNNTLKGSFTMIKWNLSRDAGILQYAQINVIHHMNKMKNKIHMIISVDTQKKLLTKCNTSFFIKTLQKVSIQGTSCCWYLVTQSCLTLCNPMCCTTLGLSASHHLPKFTKCMSISSVPSSHLIL